VSLIYTIFGGARSSEAKVLCERVGGCSPYRYKVGGSRAARTRSRPILSGLPPR
jgi:hypothetical protein